jgi:hypothetical protein
MDPKAQLHVERIALASRLEYLDVLKKHLDADDREISTRLGAIDAELARMAADDAAEDARQLEAKRRHDEETAALLDEQDMRDLVSAYYTNRRLRMFGEPVERDLAPEEVERVEAHIRAHGLTPPEPVATLTPEEETADIARQNGQREAHG